MAFISTTRNPEAYNTGLSVERALLPQAEMRELTRTMDRVPKDRGKQLKQGTNNRSKTNPCKPHFMHHSMNLNMRLVQNGFQISFIERSHHDDQQLTKEREKKNRV